MDMIVKEYEAYLEKLKGFKELAWVNNYLELKKKPNFWTVIEYGRYNSSKDKSAHETRMSKMIRWMMDPNENHGLGNVFAYKLMKWLDEDYNYCPNINKEIKTIAEYKDIDVFYKDTSQKVCLAIELKQHAKEGETSGGISQLDKYENIVEKLSGKNNLKAHYIFLTPLKEEPTNKNWIPMGYQEFIDIIDEVDSQYFEDLNLPYILDTKKIVMDFRDELQRTLDIYEKDSGFITRKLTKKERELTMILAKEIEEDSESKHMDSLIELDNENNLIIKELILLANDHLYVQNHSPNDDAKLLMRKIYNHLSGDKILDTSELKEYAVKDTRTLLKLDLVQSTNNKFTKMELTRGKGQGINIYTEDDKYRIYLSGDSHGKFPNDGVQLLIKDQDNKVKIKAKSKLLEPGKFELKDNIILGDEIYDKDGQVYRIEEMIEDYLIPALKELSDEII